MTVSGFGSNAYEPKEMKLIPNELMAYRMFRFRPRRGGNVAYDWLTYAKAEDPKWEPHLSAASFHECSYDRPGVYAASCQKKESAPFLSVSFWPQFASEFLGEERHSAPGASCACGFWAYYTPENIDTGNSMEWMAMAAVEVQGRVVLGDKGVRAEMMRIVALQIPAELANADTSIVDAWISLCAKLEVPYYWAKSELLKFHPPQDVSELLPKKSVPEYPFGYDLESYERLRKALLHQQQQQNSWLYSLVTPQTYYVNSTAPAEPTPLAAPTGSHLTMGTATQPQTYIPMEVAVEPPVTFKEVCCVCGFTVESHDKGLAEKTLAEHILGVHP